VHKAIDIGDPDEKHIQIARSVCCCKTTALIFTVPVTVTVILLDDVKHFLSFRDLHLTTVDIQTGNGDFVLAWNRLVLLHQLLQFLLLLLVDVKLNVDTPVAIGIFGVKFTLERHIIIMMISPTIDGKSFGNHESAISLGNELAAKTSLLGGSSIKRGSGKVRPKGGSG
jgi:hypothetical protein